MASNTRVAVSQRRGLLCALEVGLGKTLVALAAARQRPAPTMHLGKPLDLEAPWSDDLLNGGSQHALHEWGCSRPCRKGRG